MDSVVLGLFRVAYLSVVTEICNLASIWFAVCANRFVRHIQDADLKKKVIETETQRRPARIIRISMKKDSTS